MMRLFALMPMVAALLVPASMASAAPPPQLYNKTISVGMTVSVNARADDGSSANLPRSIQRTIYVSTKGRLFSRADRQVGRNATTTDRTPEETSKNLLFQGSKLVGVLKFPSGAAQMVVSFDSGFTSCSVNVIFGREGGQNIRFKGLNGKMYTQQGPFNVSGQSCSIREGNPFAQ